MERSRTLSSLIAILLCIAGCSKQLGSSTPSDLPPNDAVGFLIVQIRIGDDNVVLGAVEKLPDAIESHTDRDSLGYIIPKIEPLLNHDNDSIRYWAAMSLGKLGPMASAAIPQLISSLTKKMEDYSSKSSASGIQYALERISPNWIDRDDVPADVRERYSKQ
ncbi:MAG: hypothetical protein GY880_25800 [Planctomycetaceae bacterium]|nr:hypothetical protein [Planctomycetaceae bacterium]MCP4777649.1 hypothetical protein [Planctomycetaceae bacterium]